MQVRREKEKIRHASAGAGMQSIDLRRGWILLTPMVELDTQMHGSL